MHKYYEEVLECGLKLTYIYKPKFNKSYVGIGVKYGGSDLEYKVNGNGSYSKEGVAHFIEHKLFELNGEDIFYKFSKMNASANAYTGPDKTIYYFTTTFDIFNPLELLVRMFFGGSFREESVEKEKDIIKSEIKMYNDIVESNYTREILEALFPGDHISKSVAGTIESVDTINAEDLTNAYNSFYTPENSSLVIVSNIEYEKVLSKVKEIFSTIKFRKNSLLRTRMVKSNKTLSDFTYKCKVEQTTAILALRVDASNSVPLFCNMMIGLLDCLLSPSAEFYYELYEQDAFFADINYYSVTHNDAAYILISTTSKKPNLFLNMVRNKLDNFDKEMINENILDLYLRHLKSREISHLDSIEYLGDEILSLELENLSYFDEIERCQTLKIVDFYDYIDYIKKISLRKIFNGCW